MKLKSSKVSALTGDATIPGDKSLSHRALMLAALTVGRSRIKGVLDAYDIGATRRAMIALGASIKRGRDGTLVVDGRGVGGFREPCQILNMANSGTASRLISGLLAGHRFNSFMTGDASLCMRPMSRVIEPLTSMGANFTARSYGRLPIAIAGAGQCMPIEHRTKIASAQVKSAILFAGLHAPGWTRISEPYLSWDHSERMLRAFGAHIETGEEGGRHVAAIEGECELRPVDITIPTDPSSAAFVIVAALITPRSEIYLRGVGFNPTRLGLIKTLLEMGADIDIDNRRNQSGEPVADLMVRSSELKPADVPASRVPGMVDEYPILSIAAAFADGRSIMRGLGQLRVKESDRLRVMAQGLSAAGVAIRLEGDDLIVDGVQQVAGGVEVNAQHDHRIAMSFLIMGLAADAPVVVDGAETIATSFPNFMGAMNALGATIGNLDGYECS